MIQYMAGHRSRQLRKSRGIHAGSVGARFAGWQYPYPQHAIDPDNPGELGAWHTVCGDVVSWSEGSFQRLSTSCRACYLEVLARDAAAG